MTSPFAFSGSPLDRAAHNRPRLTELALRADSLFLPLWQLKFPFRDADLAWRAALPGDGLCVYLGEDAQGRAHFAVDISALPEEEIAQFGNFTDARSAAALLPYEKSAVLAQARSLIDWHARHLFCAQCGAATAPGDGGWRRHCKSCGAQHFPRTDPAVIFLVTRNDHCLLGRQSLWPEGRYSTLAGFVEPGESIEEAVRREGQEEAGVAIGEVRYWACQPWPFPSSLMIGCYAEGLSDQIAPHDAELEDVRWFSRDQARQMRADIDRDGALRLSPPISIAHQLVSRWIDS